MISRITALIAKARHLLSEQDRLGMPKNELLSQLTESSALMLEVVRCAEWAYQHNEVAGYEMAIEELKDYCAELPEEEK